MSGRGGIIASGSLYTVATVAPILSLLAVTPFVTALLGREMYGEVAVAISVHQLGSVVLGLGLPAMVTRDALLEANGFPRASGYVVLGSVLALVLAAGAILSAPWWAPLAFPGVGVRVAAAGVAAGAGLAAATLGQALLRAAERVSTFVAVACLASLMPPALGLTAIAMTGPTPEAYAIGLAVGYLFAGVVSMVITVRHAAPAFGRSAFAGAIRVGLPAIPHSLAVPALLAIAISLAARSHGLGVAAELQIAAMLGSAVVTVLNAVNNAWTPIVFKAGDERRPRILADTTFVVATVTLVLIAGYVIVAPLLVPLIGGPVVAGGEAVRASALIAMSGAPYVLYLANIHLTFLSKRTRPLAVLSPAAAAVALTVVPALTSAAGLEPVLAYALIWPSFYVLQAMFSFLLARRTPYPPADVGWSLPVLAIAFATGIQFVSLEPQPVWSLITVAGAALLVPGLFTARRRAQRS